MMLHRVYKGLHSAFILHGAAFIVSLTTFLHKDDFLRVVPSNCGFQALTNGSH